MFDEWYLARNSDSSTVYAYPSELTGIRAYRGCIQYSPTNDLSLNPVKGKFANCWGFEISEKSCEIIFDHCPKKGELLCVTKSRNGKWKSEKIELEFSN